MPSDFDRIFKRDASSREQADATPRPAAANGETDPITPAAPTDPLVEALATRLRVLDLVGWRRIATLAQEFELSFEHLRLLLALAVKVDDGPTATSELAQLAGLPLDVAYPATHRLRGRGYLREEHRKFALTEKGQELVASLDAAHREGIQAYVDQLDPEERELLRKVFATPR
jgi:DNA-binding MarR family transcriptional regulator